MKICIVSDSHDRADPLAEAVRAGKAAGAETVIHCGDLIGAQSLKPALAAGLPVHLIHGNNLGDAVALQRLSRGSGGQVQYHGADARLELGGRRVFVVHYDDYGYAMACTGDWELVCCGHSHRAEVRRVDAVRGGSSWLVNPGTVAGLAAPRTWVLGDLAAMRFEVHELGEDGKDPANASGLQVPP
ncbi:MAG: metallophosphoesterase family protein [Ideonella sp.]|nr:metallophosphoesterase family protein [Ideonella sp.]MCC7457607.1 metallophosphoesterase family protein [Nitrospira sp.]